nr:zinc finger, CCHC-type [Tanacetum cinerariifolium]
MVSAYFRHSRSKIGNGLHTRFWKDLWIGDCILSSLFPHLFALDTVKDISVAGKLQSPLVSFFRRNVRGGIEEQQLEHLVALLDSVILSNWNDRWVIDLNGDGVFRVKDVRNLLDEFFLPRADVPMRWVKNIPIKVNIFAWRLALDRLPTRANLVQRNVVTESQSCPFCDAILEDTSHLFFNCSLARDVTRLLCDTSTPKPVTPIAHYQCPKLKSTNYTVWAIQIKVILEAHGLWEAIEPKENTHVDNKKNKATTTFLYQALTEDVILQVAGCKTAKELWESLKKRHVEEEKVQQAWLQSLMIGFQTHQMKEDDTMDTFIANLNGYATNVKELGKTLDESILVRKLLDSTPDRFIQIVASIEKTNDLDDITLDEIVGKLKAFEKKDKTPKSRTSGKPRKFTIHTWRTLGKRKAI